MADVFLIGLVTAFALLIGTLIWYSNRHQSSRSGGASSAFLEDPAALVRLQLAELLASVEGDKAKGLGGVEAFDYEWPSKEKYEELKASSSEEEEEAGADASEDGTVEVITPAAAERSTARKSQLKKLLQYRANELLLHMVSFDRHVAAIVEACGQAVPSECSAFLHATRNTLMEQQAKVVEEAKQIQEGWEKTIMNTAAACTIGLERQKEMRAGAEARRAEELKAAAAKKAEEARAKEREKADAARAAKAAAAKQARDAERAYNELMAAADKKSASSKKDTRGSQKK